MKPDSNKIPVGASWRVLAHDAKRKAKSFNVYSPDCARNTDAAIKRLGHGFTLDRDVRPRREVFDELVIDGWFHLEQMGPRVWWLSIGDDMVMITIGKDGKPKMGEWYQ